MPLADQVDSQTRPLENSESRGSLDWLSGDFLRQLRQTARRHASDFSELDKDFHLCDNSQLHFQELRSGHSSFRLEWCRTRLPISVPAARQCAKVHAHAFWHWH